MPDDDLDCAFRRRCIFVIDDNTKRRDMQRLFFLIAVSLLGYSGYACDCEPQRMNVGLYNELTATFDGKVVSRATKDYSITYTIKVNHWYKGSNGTDTVQLSTASTIGACGLIKLNDTSTYLIYAYKTKQGLVSSWCTSLVDIDTWLPYNYHEDTVLLNQLIPSFMIKMANFQLAEGI